MVEDAILYLPARCNPKQNILIFLPKSSYIFRFTLKNLDDILFFLAPHKLLSLVTEILVKVLTKSQESKYHAKQALILFSITLVLFVLATTVVLIVMIALNHCTSKSRLWGKTKY